MRLAILFIAALSLSRAEGSYCTGGPKKDAKPNTYPITEPTLVHVADYKNSDVGGGRLFNAIHHLGNSTFVCVAFI